MMPRRARLAIAGIPWHIIQRGNNRSACFYADEDYQFYLETLREQAEKYGCAIHAYVLMTNHVHLLLTPDRTDSAATMMKNLGQRYVQYINRTYRRSGTLWEGRFKSCLTQNEEYVLCCQWEFCIGNMRLRQAIAQALMRRVALGKAGRPKMKSGEANRGLSPISRFRYEKN